MAGGAEAFRALAASIGRIDRAIASMARVGGATGSAQGQANLASQLRAQLQAASTSPSIVRGIREVLAQGMGGQATGDLQESVKRYNAALRRVITARDREADATQKSAQLGIQQGAALAKSAQDIAGLRARMLNLFVGMPNLQQAIASGSATPQQLQLAQLIGGRQYSHINYRIQATQQANVQQQAGFAQRIQGAQQAAAQQAGIGAQQQRVAGAWARRGQQAGLGPGGVPQGGGRLAVLGQGIMNSGLGGMGTIAGSLFGPQGAAIGFSFDMALKSVTGAFKELDKWVREGTKIVGEYARFSQGGVFASFTLQFEEFKRAAYVSRNIQLEMIEYAKAQAANIQAWKEIDVKWERLRLNLGTIGSNVQSAIGNFVTRNFGAIKDFALGAVSGGMNAIVPGSGGIPIVLNNIYDILVKWFGLDEADKNDEQKRKDALALVANHPIKAQFAAFADADLGQMMMRHKQALQRGFGMGQWGPLPGGAIAGGLAGVDAAGLFPRGPLPGGGPGQGGMQIGPPGGQPAAPPAVAAAGGNQPGRGPMARPPWNVPQEAADAAGAIAGGALQAFLPPPGMMGGAVGLAPNGLPPQNRNMPWAGPIGPGLGNP